MNNEFQQTSSTAIVSLIFGILGWTVLPWIGSIVAVIAGHIARGEIRRDPQRITGDGLAVAGLVLGWTMIVISILVVLALLVFLGGLAAILGWIGVSRF